MPGDEGRPPFEKVFNFFAGIIDAPVTKFKEKFVDPVQSGKKGAYYHRQYRRVPTIDECTTDDLVCQYEANEQYNRDKSVDAEILQILRQRRIECEVYYGPDAPTKCAKTVEDYYEASTNYFTKYGDLRGKHNVIDAFMKQKHRMIWERRHGEVGSGTQGAS